MPGLYTVVLTYVCSPRGRKATVMSCNAPRGHCSCCLLLDKVMNALQVKDVSQFKVNKARRDGLHCYCYECDKAVKAEFKQAEFRGRLAPAESAVPTSKRCGACNEVSCHCLRCHCTHCTHNQ